MCRVGRNRTAIRPERRPRRNGECDTVRCECGMPIERKRGEMAKSLVKAKFEVYVLIRMGRKVAAESKSEVFI